MTGWVDLYEESEEMDTIGFAKKHGKLGITIECGENTDPKSKENAYSSILSVLEVFGNTQMESPKEEKKQTWIHVDTILRKEKEGNFMKDWKNFDPIKKGEPIGIEEG